MEIIPHLVGGATRPTKVKRQEKSKVLHLKRNARSIGLRSTFVQRDKPIANRRGWSDSHALRGELRSIRGAAAHFGCAGAAEEAVPEGGAAGAEVVGAGVVPSSLLGNARSIRSSCDRHIKDSSQCHKMIQLSSTPGTHTLAKSYSGM